MIPLQRFVLVRRVKERLAAKRAAKEQGGAGKMEQDVSKKGTKGIGPKLGH